MKKALKQKIMLSTLLIIMIITLLQGFSFAKSESTQMIKKGEKEYIIYISNLLNSKFEFAFANKKDEIESNLKFYDSAVDSSENGNNIAYVDENIYNTYFDGKAETFLWVKGTEIKAEKIELSNALTEETIQDLNKVTKKIAIKIGNETKTEKNDEGTEVTYTKGTIVIDDNSETKYTYNMVPVKAGTDEEKLADLANKMNNLTDKNIFEKLSVYSQFKKLYEKLIPAEGWKDVESKTIKQPQESKKGDKYLVWLKADNTIDLQIMTSSEEYKENEKTENVIVKEVTKMPVTGESLVLYIVAGVLLVLIVTIVILKIKNKNSDKNE